MAQLSDGVNLSIGVAPVSKEAHMLAHAFGVAGSRVYQARLGNAPSADGAIRL